MNINNQYSIAEKPTKKIPRLFESPFAEGQTKTSSNNKSCITTIR